MAIFYLNVNDFSQATAVWSDPLLATKAPNGYYSFQGNYREQLNGFLQQGVLSCTNISTVSVTGVTQTTATFTGNLVNSGGDVNAVRGFVYGTSQNPTIANNVLTDLVVGQGGYSLTTTSLTASTSGTTYYVRAYAQIFDEYIYGAQLTFATAPVISFSVDLCYSGTSSELACDCCSEEYNAYWVTNPNEYVAEIFYYDYDGEGQSIDVGSLDTIYLCSIGVPTSGAQITAVFASCDCFAEI